MVVQHLKGKKQMIILQQALANRKANLNEREVDLSLDRVIKAFSIREPTMIEKLKLEHLCSQRKEIFIKVQTSSSR